MSWNETNRLTHGPFDPVHHILKAVVFSGVRFEVESAASLVFNTDAPTEFTGINDLVRGVLFSVLQWLICAQPPSDCCAFFVFVVCCILYASVSVALCRWVLLFAFMPPFWFQLDTAWVCACSGPLAPLPCSILPRHASRALSLSLFYLPCAAHPAGRGFILSYIVLPTYLILPACHFPQR